LRFAIIPIQLRVDTSYADTCIPDTGFQVERMTTRECLAFGSEKTSGSSRRLGHSRAH
jgi:hypothetical protein